MSACSFDSSGVAALDGGGDEAPGPDAGDSEVAQPRGDREPDHPCLDWHPLYFDPCRLAVGVDGIDIDGTEIWTYDTTTGLLIDPDINITGPPSSIVEQSDGQEARVVIARRFTVGEAATLRVVGTLPLIVVSWTSITIAGVVDASSGAGGVGAGADPLACAEVEAGSGEMNVLGGGGGGGGALAGSGGGGGRGKVSAGGTPGLAVALPSTVRGGCGGGNGGAAMVPGGSAGSGGGAVQLSARGEITVTGRIEAGGGGGRAGMVAGIQAAGGSGGGGGGGGGLISLQAAHLLIADSASLLANGGGGGEGGAHFEAGADGDDGDLVIGKAAGGSGGSIMGGDGGGGGHAVELAGRVGEDLESGGGGGGGAGYIILIGDEVEVGVAAQISPHWTAL